jgi:heme exporter protein C
MNRFTLWFHKTGSPPTFYAFAERWRPWLLGGALLLTTVALVWGLGYAPADYLQGDSFRIMYIHVPAAWMAQFVFFAMAVAGFVAIVWRIKLAEIMCIASAPIGAAYTAIALATGSLWGRPTWGTYWVWDGRLTSTLILLFLYFGVIGLYRAIEDRRKAARAAGLLSIIGMINIPIIQYSVEWWNTLHQPASINLIKGSSSIDPSMLWPLLLMAVATKLYYGWSALSRAQLMVLESERGKDWVRELAGLPRVGSTERAADPATRTSTT